MNPKYDEFFRHNFNTPLTKDEEKEFRAWAAANGKNPDNETLDYDLRGFWKARNTFDEHQHGSDLYKKPNHPTFSDESMYHGAKGPWGVFEGGRWDIPDAATQALREDATMTFTPSEKMLQTTHGDVQRLLDYLKDREPNVSLGFPAGYQRKDTIPLPESYRSGGRTSLI